jgi:hypothetical protein
LKDGFAVERLFRVEMIGDEIDRNESRVPTADVIRVRQADRYQLLRRDALDRPVRVSNPVRRHKLVRASEPGIAPRRLIVEIVRQQSRMVTKMSTHVDQKFAIEIRLLPLRRIRPVGAEQQDRLKSMRGNLRKQLR